VADLFDIPNKIDATFSAQAKVWNSDLDMLSAAAGGETGVLAAITVLPQGSPDMTLAVGSGTIKYNGTEQAVSSGNVTVTTAHSSLDRIDLVVVSSAGVKSVTAGTAAATPVQPEVPANSICLAQVYVPAGDTAIGSTQIRGRQILVPGAQGGAIDIQTFTADGTWTKPSGALLCDVIAVGQGGGGGSGRRGTNSQSSGGGGGGGGAIVRRVLPAGSLSGTEAVSLNAAGGGGAAQTVNDTDGTTGTAGEDTTLGTTKVIAKGGAGGTFGDNSGLQQGGAGGLADASSFDAWTGGSGGTGEVSTGGAATGIPTVAQLTDVHKRGGGGGGGGGGGLTTSGTTGGNGGDCFDETGGAGGAQAVGAVGGSVPTNEPAPGAGGGGGGSVITSGAGRAGGNGGNYGGGGGGGSGSVNGQNSGAGGNGGPGILVVITYTS
jgi:Glycine-rich domain